MAATEMRASQRAFQWDEDIEQESATVDEEAYGEDEDEDGETDGEDEDDGEAYGGVDAGDEIKAEIGEEEEDTGDVYDIEVSLNDPLSIHLTETLLGRF